MTPKRPARRRAGKHGKARHRCSPPPGIYALWMCPDCDALWTVAPARINGDYGRALDAFADALKKLPPLFITIGSETHP